MIPITFYNFAKKPKSTKQPDVNGTTANCELIEDTSIINPKIRWHEPAIPSVNVYDFNYCYIAIFQRYYFVVNVTYQLGTWVLDLTVDVMATGRDIIGPSTQYVMRSASAFDGTVEDGLYPVKNDFITAGFHTYDVDEPSKYCPVWAPISELGQWYVVGIICNSGQTHSNVWDWLDLLQPNTSNNGSVVYYVLDQDQMFAMMEMLLTKVSDYGILNSEISLELQKQLINPLQYVESVRLYPFKPYCLLDAQDHEREVDYIPIGFNELEVPKLSELGGWKLLRRADSIESLRPVIPGLFGGNGWIKYNMCTTRCLLHPQYADRGQWVLGAPYSSYKIEVEPWGIIDIPPQAVIESFKATDEQNRQFFTITYETWSDFATGACKLQISILDQNGNYLPFYCETAQVGIDIPCHQSTQDVVGFKKTVMELAGAKVNHQVTVGASIANTATMGMLGGSIGYDRRGAMQKGVGSASGIIGSVANAAHSSTDWAVQEPVGIMSLKASSYPTISGSGSSSGSFIIHAQDMASPRVFAYWAILVEDNNTDHGRPLCAKRTISSLSGYILCENAHIQSRLTATENQMIEDFMNGGFYYE